MDAKEKKVKKLWHTVREVAAAELTRVVARILVGVLAALGVVDVAQGDALRRDAAPAAVVAVKP